ncbi:hypothetical protein CYMTET_52212 [Cymbomonas tetramitiformis]|uniref:Uncharacterized protein n=1 Tax=Cymbomonas tetramitiformis TaxID=36881 RepID=A0AAE0BKN5_9CHLO|nr:hypothetical protein CYMTET_52212 [Cymbomonas tetramitiformis]
MYRAVAPSAPVRPARTSEERAASDAVSLMKQGQLALREGFFGAATGERHGPCGETLGRLTGKVGIGVPGGTETCVHAVQALLGAIPLWCALQLNCKNASNMIHRRAISEAVFDDFLESLGIT